MIPRPGFLAALLLAASLAGGGCRPARPEAAAVPIPDGRVANATSAPAQPASPVAAPQHAPRLPELPAGAAGDLARYGRAIIDNTPAALQEAARRQGKRTTGGRLSCRNCHLGGGTRESAFPWFGSSGTYPRYDPRAGRVIGLAEQVNACVTRSINAPPLAADSREMAAILAYIAAFPPAAASRQPAPGFPDRAADLADGEEVYRDFCRSCHGADGAGRPDVPPLWGAGSYATGASLHRVTTAAGFIRAQMPPRGERLNAADAFDVAAYVNSFERPHTADLHLDYPVLSEKPVDCPYPPFPDRFPAYRHKYGPFAEIVAEARARGTGEPGR